MAESSNKPTHDPQSEPKPAEDPGKATKNRWSWLNSAFTVAVIGIVGVLAAIFIPHILNHAPDASPRLEVDGITVSPAKYYPNPEKIDFKLRNIGNQVAVITGVKLRVEQFAQLPICFTQGDLPVTGNYHATIPRAPAVGTTIDIPVSQQARPDTADQFQVSLHPWKDPGEAVSLYMVHASLLYDNTNVALNAGNITFSLPFDPNYQYYWTRAMEVNHGSSMAFMGAEVPHISGCMINNAKKIRSLLSLTSYRPSSLSHLLTVMAYCCKAKAPPVSAVHCNGHPLVRPSSVPIKCDGTEQLQHMNWSAWTATYATGEGLLRFDSCNPSCSAGRISTYHTIVNLGLPSYSKYGWEWTSMILKFPDRAPNSSKRLTINDFAPTS